MDTKTTTLEWAGKTPPQSSHTFQNKSRTFRQNPNQKRCQGTRHSPSSKSTSSHKRDNDAPPNSTTSPTSSRHGRSQNLWAHNPKIDSQVFVNVWSILRDDAYWDEPIIFKPKRFLDLEIDFRGRDFSFTPFGAGRRIYLGLNLAMRMVSLLLANRCSWLTRNFFQDNPIPKVIAPHCAQSFTSNNTQ